MSPDTATAIGYSIVVCGIFAAVAVYIGTIAYGVNRLEKSVQELQATVAKHSRKPPTKPKSKGGKKNVQTKR